MQTMMNRAWMALILLACSSPGGDATASGEEPQDTASTSGEVRLERVVSGLSSPLYLTAPVDDPRLFIVEQPGRIRVVKNGALLPTPFLDLTDRVSSGGERGLLSVAFHPSYRTNGFLYVNYTDNAGDTRIERYTVSAEPDRADRATAKLLLTIDQPYGNHNGGLNLFGPDGKLYIGMGDGGSGGDPQNHGQNANTLLGALLRIDVDAGDPYAVPADNPYATGGGRGEVWATGLRNPWRFTFDRADGLLYIADVGQNRWEEVNVSRADRAGLNYGWNIMEAGHCFRGDSCRRSGLVMPAIEYDHDDGCSITGGIVYRGSAVPALRGHYLYSDWCAGWVKSFRYAGGAATDRRQWPVQDIGRVLSFGEDAAGEVYILSDNGSVYRFVSGS